jgi:hypothetical protein
MSHHDAFAFQVAFTRVVPKFLQGLMGGVHDDPETAAARREKLDAKRAEFLDRADLDDFEAADADALRELVEKVCSRHITCSIVFIFHQGWRSACYGCFELEFQKQREEGCGHVYRGAGSRISQKPPSKSPFSPSIILFASR